MPLPDHPHRAFPPPRSPWALRMAWLDLCFLHWAVDAAALAWQLPPGLQLDTYGKQAYLGVVPFRMSDVRPRLTPSLPGLSFFPELNLRTYVTAGGVPGVWFFSLDAANPLAVRLARAAFHLPYFDARMSAKPAGEGMVYRSQRAHRGAVPVQFGPSTPRLGRCSPPRRAAWRTG